jgi:F0F1-type ATP synthase delta subunit
MREHYITAFLDLIATGMSVEAAVAGLSRTLASRDHSRLLPAILRGAVRRLEGSEAGTARVVIAKSQDVIALRTAIETHLVTLGASTDATITIDETIVGGVVVEHAHTRIDASWKTALRKLYERVTN